MARILHLIRSPSCPELSPLKAGAFVELLVESALQVRRKRVGSVGGSARRLTEFEPMIYGSRVCMIGHYDM